MLPAVGTAKLPVVYERAKEALTKCSTIDECAEWKNKAAAMASYARQADDESLFQMATRIKARAIRRYGELLKQIEPAKGANQNIRGVDPPKVHTRTEAAKAAGLSKDQQKQAIRVASIPSDTFERAVESPKPPTVTELAKQGTTTSTVHLKGRDPRDFEQSTRVQSALRAFALIASEVAPAVAVRGALPHEFGKMNANANTATA